MPTRDELLIAVAGKGVERGLTPEMMDGYVLLHYDENTTEREDNLHKQSIRSLIKRVAPDWKIHIASVDAGFSVEVRPKPGKSVEPNPPVEQPESVEKIDKLTDTLEALLKSLQSA